jgi:DNA-binding transcriptional MocR family regulator
MSSIQLPLYQQLADHYLDAIRMGALKVGDRFPSVRQLMRTHEVSLSTALQTCRRLEEQGWLHARPRSGYYVQRARRTELLRASESHSEAAIDPANYVGIHSHVSEILAHGQQHPISVNLALAVGSTNLYPAAALNRIMQRMLRQQPNVLTTMARRHGHPALRTKL